MCWSFRHKSTMAHAVLQFPVDFRPSFRRISRALLPIFRRKMRKQQARNRSLVLAAQRAVGSAIFTGRSRSPRARLLMELMQNVLAKCQPQVSKVTAN